MSFILWNSFSLLDKQSITARTKVFVKDPLSNFENVGTYQYTTFTVENASVQPTTDKNLLLLGEGIRDYESYTIYTTSVLKPSEETTNDLADQVQLDGLFGVGWFTVVKSKKYGVTSSGPQYEVIVVKYPNNT